MDKPTPEEIEAAVRRGCRGLPEAVVQIKVDEALREGIFKMKIISNQWGEYMDYCAKNNKMPTEDGFRVYSENAVEALREMERITIEECTIKDNIVHGSIEGGVILGTAEVKIEGNIGIFTPVVVWRD